MVEQGSETQGSALWTWAVETIDPQRSVQDIEREVRCLWANTEANRAYIHDLLTGREQVCRQRLCAMELLGKTLKQMGKDPLGESLSRRPEGKPYLIGCDGAWDVSLSHSHGYVACGVIRGGRIGVDVEEFRHLTDERACRMAERFFSEAERQIEMADAHGFVRRWTVREAVCKLDGRGGPLRVDTTALPQDIWQYTCPLDGGYVTVVTKIHEI